MFKLQLSVRIINKKRCANIQFEKQTTLALFQCNNKCVNRWEGKTKQIGICIIYITQYLSTFS